MNQRAVLIFCLILLTLNGTKGIPLNRASRCSCIKISHQPVNPKSIKKLEVIPKSTSCPSLEVIATMKNNGEKICLDPETEMIKNILKAFNKKRSKRSQTPREA
ncbi:C-X-C motif chemokine 10 [Pipistrellus kuhlii]|uniref:C-X-C motif chemokine n=1 Tax=Pipistrellus kuhlii TaxID=59472 RepID=A0A7J8B006_PIPKU|nr:C-X-C motif chemokine 10 [Pipistrellus kuhlii]KAF6391690.1 C-X-C motif chemokine ligand 10 [Pipistrellus kuhlii]